MLNLPDFAEIITNPPSEEEVRMYRAFKRLKKDYSSEALLELAGLLIKEVRHREYEKYADTPRKAKGVLDLPDF